MTWRYIMFTLKNCTKDELIYIIEHYSLCDIDAALKLTETRRISVLLLEQEKLSVSVSKAFDEYLELARPYEGKCDTEIPPNVFRKILKASNNEIEFQFHKKAFIAAVVSEVTYERVKNPK